MEPNDERGSGCLRAGCGALVAIGLCIIVCLLGADSISQALGIDGLAFPFAVLSFGVPLSALIGALVGSCLKFVRFQFVAAKTAGWLIWVLFTAIHFAPEFLSKRIHYTQGVQVGSTFGTPNYPRSAEFSKSILKLEMGGDRAWLMRTPGVNRDRERWHPDVLAMLSRLKVTPENKPAIAGSPYLGMTEATIFTDKGSIGGKPVEIGALEFGYESGLWLVAAYPPSPHENAMLNRLLSYADQVCLIDGMWWTQRLVPAIVFAFLMGVWTFGPLFRRHRIRT